MAIGASPVPPPDFEEQRLALSLGVGWPEIVALDVRIRPEPRVAIGTWFGVNGGGSQAPLYSTPMGYVRWYLEGSQSAPFFQFGAGSRVKGLFGGDPLSASPLIMATYGYEWRWAKGLTVSVDVGGIFDFSLAGASPILRGGLRVGYLLL
jgi:hypothetical protein